MVLRLLVLIRHIDMIRRCYYTYDENGTMGYARFRIDTATFVVDDFECTNYGFFAYSELPFDNIGFPPNKIIDKIF